MTINKQKMQTFLDHLYSIDFKERPVTISKFLSDRQFLGNFLEGGRAVYPVWKESLTEVMCEDSKYLVILTGAIGTGKTTAAVWGLAYVIYRILCLKNPWKYFGLASGGKLAIPFFNLTKTLGASTSYQLLHSYMTNSSWFLKHGHIRGKEDIWLDIPIFEYILASPYARGFGTLGQNVITGIMDEVDSPNESEKQKRRVLDAYNNTSRRFISRFVDPQSGETLGKLFIVSSKQETVSFLSTFIAERKGSPEVYVKDIAIWEAKPDTQYSGKKFHVMVGDVYTPAKVITSIKELQEAQKLEFRIIEVPIEYKEAFIVDVIGSLRDLAGVSVESSRMSKLFSSEQVLENCYDKSKIDPVKKPTILVGLHDNIDLMNFVDFSKIRVPKKYPRYIHCDIAYSGEGDALGLGISSVSGWMKVNQQLADGNIEERKMPVVETDFVLRIKGKPGDQIDFSAIRRFILDFRLLGFKIGKFTADHRAMSTDTLQILENAGISTGYLSLDKTPEGYLLFRDLVIQKRWICHKDKYLHFELSNLDYDTVKNKIDHPDKIMKIVFLQDGDTREIVMKGSKDKADGLVGSVIGALEDIKIPPDVEVIRNLMGKAIKSVVPKLGITRMSDVEFMKDGGLRITKKKSEVEEIDTAKTSTAKTIKNMFKKIQNG